MRSMISSSGAAVSADRSDPTRSLLACGAAAGVLFVVVSFGQVFTRAGFDLQIHPLSALALGDLGWIQVTNFLLTGLLSIACAVGLRRALHPGRAGTWGPVLIGAYGIGHIGAGIFATDPGFGFPAGAPAGMPEQFSGHAVLHTVFAMLLFVSLAAACFVFARRFAGLRQRSWAAYSVLTGVASLVLVTWPDTDGASTRFAVGAVLTSAWLLVTTTRLRGHLTDRPEPKPTDPT